MYIATYGTYDLNAIYSVAALEISVIFIRETKEHGVFFNPSYSERME